MYAVFNRSGRWTSAYTTCQKVNVKQGRKKKPDNVGACRIAGDLETVANDRLTVEYFRAGLPINPGMLLCMLDVWFNCRYKAQFHSIGDVKDEIDDVKVNSAAQD